MGIIRLPQDYAVRRQAESVREAFQSIGEEAIFLRMRHAIVNGIPASNITEPRCTRCWDSDYGQSTDEFCPNCFGTTFDKPVKYWGRVWTLFSDNTTDRELMRKWGEWNTDDRDVQMESAFEVGEHDYLIRIFSWTPDHKPVKEQGRYRIDNTIPLSLRTGSRLGMQRADIIGVSLKAHLLPSAHAIQKFGLDLTNPVPRYSEK